MGSLGVPFCSVCSEALVLAIYQRVRPVDGFSPASTNFSVTTTQALAFSLALLQPATHNLNVQWFTNGVPCDRRHQSQLHAVAAIPCQWHQLGQRRGQGQHLAGAQRSHEPLEPNGHLGAEREPPAIAAGFAAVADGRKIRLPNLRQCPAGGCRPEFDESVELGSGWRPIPWSAASSGTPIPQPAALPGRSTGPSHLLEIPAAAPPNKKARADRSRPSSSSISA